jgi:hypothetical protein
MPKIQSSSSSQFMQSHFLAMVGMKWIRREDERFEMVAISFVEFALKFDPKN